MARSKYVYVLTWQDHVQSAAPIFTATVKREFLDALAELNGLDDTDAWRMGDGAVLDRTYLGSGAEMLARERPVKVVDVRAALDQLDGTTPSAVALLTGYTPEQLDALGGFEEKPDGT